MRLDFPTFERPRKAISGKPSVVQCDLLKALLTNSADVIFMVIIFIENERKFNIKERFLLTDVCKLDFKE